MSRHSEQLESIERDIDATRGRIDSTLDALTEKVSASRLVGQAIDSVRENGGMFASNLVHTARDNPVPISLLATGLAWLMISDRRGRTAASNGHAQPGSHAHAAPAPGYVTPDHTTPAAPGQPTAGMAGTTASDRARAAAGTAAGAMSSTVHKVGDGARSAGDAVRGAAGQVGDAASRTKAAASDAAASARATAHDLRDRVGAVGQGAGQRAAGAYAGARDVTRRTTSYLAENPLMIGALGLAIGAVVAAALPATRREDEWLGEAGDALRDQGASAARHVAHEGAQVAEAAADSAREEAKRRKLTPADARQAAEEGATEVARGAAEVARSAVRTAEAETRRRTRTGNGAPQAH